MYAAVGLRCLVAAARQARHVSRRRAGPGSALSWAATLLHWEPLAPGPACCLQQAASLPVCPSASLPVGRVPVCHWPLASGLCTRRPPSHRQQPAASSTSQRCWVLVALCRVIGSSALADKCRGSAEPIAGSGGSSQSHRAVQKLETGRSHLTEQQQQSPPAVACAGLARVDGRRRKPRCSQ